MSMELEADDATTRIPVLPPPNNTDIGRGPELSPSDRTISRRHVSLQLAAPAGEDRVSFEVVGKNPVLVVTSGGAKKIFRHSEVGELGTGDRISLSLRNPFFFSLKRLCGGGEVDSGVLEAVQRRERRTVQRKEQEEAQEREAERVRVSSVKGGRAGAGGGFEAPELSEIDPVKEFGFLVRGHEFDNYPRKIRDVKHWNWFLHEHRASSDEEDHPDVAPAARNKKGRRSMKRKEEDNNDEDWTGESEEEVVSAAKAAVTAKRAKYLTRSKDQRKQKPTSGGEGSADRKGSGGRKRGFEEEDEEDETLGGFIVDNGEEGEEEQDGEEEGEELDDQDDHDDDDDDD